MLPDYQAAQVEVWAAQHPVIFTFLIHTPDACPWIYSVDFLTHSHDTPWWANRVYRFYRAKHLLERHCTCDQVQYG
jgi:hypothetical protein